MKTLIQSDGVVHVPISHSEVDSLIGQLMQTCDILGDSTQREAFKSEVKQKVRRWLDNQYEELGYRKHNYDPNAWIIDADDDPSLAGWLRGSELRVSG